MVLYSDLGLVVEDNEDLFKLLKVCLIECMVSNLW